MGRARQLCEEWQARVATMARNLTDFADAPEAVAVRARLLDPAHPYEGRTFAEASAATRALAGLWQDYLLVLAVIEEAEDKLRRPGLFNRDDEVVALLEGASIRLPALSVPILRRGLLDPVEANSVATPGEVVASMTRAFETARDTLKGIADAERDGDAEAAALAAALDALEPRARALSMGTDRLARARVALDGALCDPLGRRDDLSGAGFDVAAVESAVRERETAIAGLGERLARGMARLAALRETLGAIAAALVERRTRIADVLPPAQGVEGDDLVGWLDRLKTTFEAGRIDPALVGLTRWEEAIAARESVAATVLAAARLPLARMDDLKGRFRALRAKAAARGPDAAAAEAAAKAALARTPCPLAEADRLVAAFEAQLARPRTSA